MMAGSFRGFFLFSSFGPLYLIFAIKLAYNPGVSLRWSIISALLFILSIVVFFGLVDRFSSDNATLLRVVDIKSKDSEIFSYLTTYIPQLLTRNMANPAEVWPLVVLYAVIVLAYLRLDAPYINPFFVLFGYRIYEGRIGNSRNLITIVVKNVTLGGSADLTLHEVANGTLYYCEVS